MKTQIRETRENAGDQVTIGFRLHLIGEKDVASFVDQSKTDFAKPKQNFGFNFNTQLKIALCMELQIIGHDHR